jgi:hypothetical protein
MMILAVLANIKAMAKKSKFLINSVTLEYCGPNFLVIPKPLGQPNTLEITSPINMVVTRCTIQVQGELAQASPAAVLISDHIPSTNIDGFMLIQNEVQSIGIGGPYYLPANFTIENFGDESISQSIFLSNFSSSGSDVYCSVIWEGYINE